MRQEVIPSLYREFGQQLQIMAVGLSFTLAVFLSYLAFGMLLREVLAGLVGRGWHTTCCASGVSSRSE